MVKLNSNQQAALARLRAAKENYDSSKAELELVIERLKEDRMLEIRNAVASAESAGVPNRQIYMNLGFDQPAPYLNFMKRRANSAMVNAINLPAQSITNTNPSTNANANTNTNTNANTGQVAPTFLVGTEFPEFWFDSQDHDKVYITDTFGNDAGFVYCARGSGGVGRIVTEIKGVHTDIKELRDAIMEFLREEYPEDADDIEWV